MSEIVVVCCESLFIVEEVVVEFGMYVEIIDFIMLGGWGIFVEVYYVKDGG